MQTILVYADWYQFSKPKLVGELHHDFIRAKSVYSFEYDADWIKQGISIDPDLPLLSGFHHAKDESNFGIFQDSSPDRWGQMLMKRREVHLAKEQQRPPRALQAIDFLLGVHDRHRMGALRFKLHHEDEFLSNDEKLATPPWASLRELVLSNRTAQM